jgi:hypothetical protein
MVRAVGFSRIGGESRRHPDGISQLLTLCLVVTVSVAMVNFARGQDCWIEREQFGNGFAVTIDGDVAAVGDAESYVTVYRQSGSSWIEEQVFTRIGPGLFGFALDLENPVLVIGDTFWGASSSAYVYRHDGAEWVLEATLGFDDPESMFGWSVSLEGNWLAVSHGPAAPSGRGVSIYEYDGNDWVLRQILEQDRETYWLAMDPEWLVLGGNPLVPLVVYRRVGDVWQFYQEFPGLNAQLVAIDQNWLAASAGWLNAVVIFEFDGTSWVERQTLTGSPGFGNSLFMRGVELLVGNPDSDAVDYCVRTEGTYELVSQLLPDDPGAGNPFGQLVAMDEEHCLVGGDPSVLFEQVGFGLQIDPEIASEGETVTFSTQTGDPGTFARLFVTEVSGVPLMMPGPLGAFDDHGDWNLPLLVPPDLEGESFSFLSIGHRACGGLEVSEVATVAIQ